MREYKAAWPLVGGGGCGWQLEETWSQALGSDTVSHGPWQPCNDLVKVDSLHGLQNRLLPEGQSPRGGDTWECLVDT